MNEERRASAPYNFIPFEKITVKATDELTYHDRFLADRKSGKITYELVNETELFVGGNENEKHFFGDEENYIIPGSTMRGFVRANAEILSLSYPEMIEDRRMMYRSFADKCSALRNQYSEKMRGSQDNNRTSLKQSIKAGYLFWENEHKLCIVPAKEFEGRGCNYVSVHESDLRKDDVLLNDNQYMYKKQIKKLKDYQWGNIPKREKEMKYRKMLEPNDKYRPYGNQPFSENSQIIQFDYDGTHIIGLNQGTFKGYAFNSQWIYGKVNHYVINVMSKNDVRNADEKYVIDTELVLAYEKDLEARKKQNKDIEKHDKYYNLPYKDKKRAIGLKHAKIFFFRTDKDGKVTDFGPTPYFRTFYDNSIKAALPTEELETGYDFVTSVFGYTKENESEHYEGRVNFMNCTLSKNVGSEGESSKVILANPKPTSFQLYLVQKTDNIKQLITYNAEQRELELRGRKFYWKKENAQGRKGEIRNNNILTEIYPLEKHQRFKGTIYFENLTRVELGMILSSMQLNEKDTDMIGYAKPYGFGKIRFENISVLYEKKDEAFLNLESFYEEADGNRNLDEINGLKKEFQKEMEAILEREYHKNYSELKSIALYREIKALESTNELGDENGFAYMELEEFKQRDILEEAGNILPKQNFEEAYEDMLKSFGANRRVREQKGNKKCRKK